MEAFSDYTLSLWGILIIILTVLVQSFSAGAIKAAQPNAVPGKIDDGLSHDSLVFRSNRTFLNSVENVPMMLGAAFLAILCACSPLWTAVLIWVFAVSRIAHMALYYLISTEKNPSPRSYFYLLGFGANLGLLILCAITLLAR